jgi:signal transduction histidine kinase
MNYLKSYQSRILLSFLGLTFVLACWFYYQHQINTRNKQLDDLAEKVYDLEASYLIKTRHLQNFLLYGYHQANFYKEGTQPDIDSFQTYLQKSDLEIGNIRMQIEKNRIDVKGIVDTLSGENQKLIRFIKDLKAIYLSKGFKDFGVEGKMRYYAHLLQDSALVPELEVLKLRRSEKDFLLRGESQYSDAFFQMINPLIEKYKNQPYTKAVLENYRNNFDTLAAFNKKIGLYSSEGLFKHIQEQLSNVDRSYLLFYKATLTAVVKSKKQNESSLYYGATVFILLFILIIWALSKYLSREIKKLNEIILSFIHSGFNTEYQEDNFKPAILEVNTLYRSFKLLKHKLGHILEERHQHQKMLVSAVIDSQEKERKNIGAELHDNINPMLATAKIYLNVARENANTRMEMINTSNEIIETTIGEVRKLSHSLVGPAKDFQLKESLQDLISTVRMAATFNIKFVSNYSDESQLDEGKKLTLYRIVQEQLSNVMKYSKAEDVLISIREKPNELLLCIKDNGVGFDTLQKPRGIGLRNIETRLELVNGKMFINTSPGNGCEMVVTVPL